MRRSEQLSEVGIPNRHILSDGPLDRSSVELVHSKEWLSHFTRTETSQLTWAYKDEASP